MAVKAALGAAVLAGVGVVGVRFMSSGTVNYKTLHEDGDFTGTNKSQYTSKWGSEYSRFLIGATDAYNDEWWDLSFRNNYQTISDLSNIKTSSFKENNAKFQDYKKLRDACKNAYKGESGKVKSGASTSDSSEFEESEVWKFCSPLGKKPSTINDKDTNSYSGKKGDDSSNKSKYVSVTDESNNVFWELKNKEFYDSSSGNTNSGAKATANGFFKKAYDKKTHIKQACKEAYETSDSASENGQPTKEEILKFCSLTGK